MARQSRHTFLGETPEAECQPEDTPRSEPLGAPRGGSVPRCTPGPGRGTHRLRHLWEGPRLRACAGGAHVRMRVHVKRPVYRWWACTHVYPGGAPAAWIALQGKAGR